MSVLFSEHAHCELTWLHAYGFLFMQGVVFWRGAGKQQVVTQLSDFCLVLSSSTMQPSVTLYHTCTASPIEGHGQGGAGAYSSCH